MCYFPSIHTVEVLEFLKHIFVFLIALSPKNLNAMISRNNTLKNNIQLHICLSWRNVFIFLICTVLNCLQTFVPLTSILLPYRRVQIVFSNKI